MVSEAVAQVTKAVSGALPDQFGRRKPFVVLGYGLDAITKPVFALAGSTGLAKLFAARRAMR
jgi:hypothetical protein